MSFHSDLGKLDSDFEWFDSLKYRKESWRWGAAHLQPMAHHYLPTPAPSWSMDTATYISRLPLQTRGCPALLSALQSTQALPPPWVGQNRESLPRGLAVGPGYLGVFWRGLGMTSVHGCWWGSEEALWCEYPRPALCPGVGDDSAKRDPDFLLPES